METTTPKKGLFQRELIGGLTTFVTMSYIMFVNPTILGDAGVPFNQAFMATVIATIVGTLIMGLYAKYPIAIAPGMGMNAYFAYSVVNTKAGVDYKTAFATAFVAGIIFLLISFTPLRKKLIEAIPESLRYAITAGIGLFIAFIGMRLSGVIKDHPTNLVALGDIHSPSVILTLIGLFITLIFYILEVPGSLFIGMLATGVIAYFTGQLKFEGFVSVPPVPELVISNPIASFQDVIANGLYAAVFSFFLITLFDTTGTVLGLAKQANLMEGNRLPRSERALMADSIATVTGSIFGTSPTSAYIESSSGIAAGARTGWAAVVVAVLFALSTFIAPVVGAVSKVSAITAPALIIVGSLMISQIRHLKWDNFAEAFPAFLVILSMPLTSSIATGIALGFVSYPVLKLVARQGKEVHPLLYIFGFLFLIQLIFFPH